MFNLKNQTSKIIVIVQKEIQSHNPLIITQLQ